MTRKRGLRGGTRRRGGLRTLRIEGKRRQGEGITMKEEKKKKRRKMTNTETNMKN